jgi:uncharacterized protein (TIGR02147 family)
MIIFDFRDYKKYLNSRIEGLPKRGRGVRLQLATAANCQAAYVSHVLSGNNHFSLEQAEAVARYFALTPDETEYFFLLIQHARAGTHALRTTLAKAIDKRAEKFLNLKSRVKIRTSLNSEDQSRYYSAWHYSAVHMALTIPKLRRVDSLTAYLDLPPKRVHEILEFLLEKNLIELKGNEYHVAEGLLHLEKKSPLIIQHHTQWRLKAIQALTESHASDDEESLHYSLCFSISEADAVRLKNRFATFIESCAELIKPSPEEKLYSLALDLFEVR